MRQVVVNDREQRIDVYLDHEPGIKVRCPECGVFYGMYDHAPECVYRHLNVCQMETYIHVRLPRVNCPQQGSSRLIRSLGKMGPR
jgi:transposase